MTKITGSWTINNNSLMQKDQYSMHLSGNATWTTGYLYTANKIPITQKAKILHIHHSGTGPASNGATIEVGVGTTQTSLATSVSVPAASGYIADLTINLQDYVGQSVYIIFKTYVLSIQFTGNTISEIYLTE